VSIDRQFGRYGVPGGTIGRDGPVFESYSPQMMRHRGFALFLTLVLGSAAAAGAQAPRPGAGAPQGPPTAANPYRLAPFHADYPVVLEYPNHHGREYDRTRRQVVARIVANLQGACRREAWQSATEFFWDGPEEAIEPLIEAMDRHFGDPSMQDMVRNCVDAMGRMSDPAFDEALQRALEHRNDNVRQSALGALATSSTTDTLRALQRIWPQMNARSRNAWLRAARMRLGDEAVPIFRQFMMADYSVQVRDQVLMEVLKMPVADAASILRGRWQQAQGEFKAIIAGVLHGAGDSAGTIWLRDTLTGEDLASLPLAVRHCHYGDLGVLRAPLLALSSHPRADVRMELAKVLTKVDGEDIADVYELLSHPDEIWEIKSLALRELSRRGRTGAASALIEEVETAKGTRLQLVLNMLGATRDPRAVPIFKKRFLEAPEGEGRPFLQSLAVLDCGPAAVALLELFGGPEKSIGRGTTAGHLTTCNYIPLMLLNLRGNEQAIVDFFRELPKEDWRRRALLMSTVVGMASDSKDEAIEAMTIPVVKEVLFDQDELPQLRVQALNLLTRSYLTIDDVMRLKNGRQTEPAAMRALLTDFLFDYF